MDYRYIRYLCGLGEQYFGVLLDSLHIKTFTKGLFTFLWVVVKLQIRQKKERKKERKHFMIQIQQNAL